MDVLVVDDESTSRQTVEYALREAGYRVTTARDGQEALLLLKEQLHQLVVSDWHMPRMDGIELCRAIRGADLRRYVYFIMVTSSDQMNDAISGFETGVDDYIVKPFHPIELQMRVNAGRRIVEQETGQITIFALAKLAESRDTDTGVHLDRVRSYCRVLAAQLQLNPAFNKVVDAEFLKLIYNTSPLHDIGKVAIPDSILLKPGKLTSDEFEVMKTHSLRGAETLEAALQQFPNARFLRMAKDIALTHHEKFDGSGYPQGLAGQQIPLCGRIVALADVYDALTSQRVYKAAMGHEEAKTIIENDRGKHFDPAIVDAFLDVETEF
ncbi:MAG TPA: HD domain-containing phosphohydrolase, partial [Pirellula sp.]|nr:HD domain-containing phosphohydrolase [Pirellula sp.]